MEPDVVSSRLIGMRAIDLAGRRFGRLVAQERDGGSWRCLCDCGNELIVKTGNLSSGNTKSCGCHRRDVMRATARARSEARPATDLVGQRFARLLVLERAANTRGNVNWHVICDCGTQKTATSAHLVHGQAKSCGCLCSGTSTRLIRQADFRVAGELAPRRGLVWKRDGGTCHLCQKNVDGAWHMDHVISLAEYGPHCMDNVAVSCVDCNLAKHVGISWDSPAFPRAAAAYARLHGVEISQDTKKRRHDLGLPVGDRMDQ